MLYPHINDTLTLCAATAWSSRSITVCDCISKYPSFARSSQLRRHSGTILRYFSGNSELHAEMQTLLNAQAVCCRETFNRHGHTLKNPYPGFTGWDQAYYDARVTSGAANVTRKLAAMKG